MVVLCRPIAVVLNSKISAEIVIQEDGSSSRLVTSAPQRFARNSFLHSRSPGRVCQVRAGLVEPFTMGLGALDKELQPAIEMW